MNCRKVRRYLFGYFRGELSSQEAETIRAHLAVCPDCAKEAEQIETLCLALRENVETVVPSPDFNQRLLERLQASPSGTVVLEKAGWWADLLHEIFPSIRLRWAMAGAAAVVIAAFALIFTQRQSPMEPGYMSEAQQQTPAQVLARSQDASDSAYADLMRRLAEGSVTSEKAFVIDNLSFPSAAGEDGVIPLDDLSKRFVIERTSVPARQTWLDSRYILPVVSNRRIPERPDY
jgi:anti-sigma-K factor RskA